MKSTYRNILIVFVLALAALACNTLLPSSEPQPQATEPPHSEEVPIPVEGPESITGSSEIAGLQTYTATEADHQHVDVVPEPEGNLPPVFGAHYPQWQNCGIYDQPVELGYALHSMEHGAVWLTYRPDLPETLVLELRDFARGHGFVLMSPYPKQTSDVVMTAWGVQVVIDSLPDARVEQFIAVYENGPQNPEPGAPCSGAFGTPIE